VANKLRERRTKKESTGATKKRTKIQKLNPHTTTNPQQIKEKQRTTNCLENTPVRQGPCNWKTIITEEKNLKHVTTQVVAMDTNHKKSQNVVVPSRKRGGDNQVQPSRTRVRTLRMLPYVGGDEQVQPSRTRAIFRKWV